MICGLSWSGGKDATLALDRSVRDGLDIRYLFNIHEADTGRMRFHGVRRELIRAQAAALGRELIEGSTHTGDFEAVFVDLLALLRDRGVEAIVFGNIHLADVRGWYEERVIAAGLRHVEPLWGSAPADVPREFVERGYRARIVSIDLARTPPAWLGREFDAELIRDIEAMSSLDAAGERGEYHSFTYDGPLFRAPVAFTDGQTLEREGHRMLDLVPATGAVA